MLVTSFAILFLGQCFATPDLELIETDIYSLLNNNLNRMNSELFKLNSITSYLSWKLSTEPDSSLASKFVKFGSIQGDWKEKWCSRLNQIFRRIHNFEKTQEEIQTFLIHRKNYDKEYRQFYLLCRGPKYNSDQNRELVNVLGKLVSLYETSQVCVTGGKCFRGEPDLERVMFKSRNPNDLLWAWTEWRNKIGPPSRVLYPSMVDLLNQGAKNNGYNEIGECWREELEVDNLEELVENLYKEIEPLYIALHAVVRYKLQKYYKSDLISLTEPIPAHLLGNMWAQNWGGLLDIIIDVKKENSLTYYLQKKNYTVKDMVKKAEDFFVSLGFSPMTPAFWKYSKLRSEAKNGSTCHGTAANMFQPNDFRIILCAEVTGEDFSVVHHEMGHIEYYMEYENQTTIFQDGVNSAFQESIGDAIMYGVVSPVHLQRLGLIQEIDQSSEGDIAILLHQALIKLPQISYALVLEKWRWSVFKGEISPKDYNKAWWALRERYQGLKPPVPRSEKYFDPSAKFHVNDNQPYIRYFLSSFLQMQIFEALCKGAIYGEDYKNQSLPLPLHRCDIYGSKSATKNLRKIMSLGNSISWKEALVLLTGEDSYSVRPLLEYYKPLHFWLMKEITEHNIPVGWGLSY